MKFSVVVVCTLALAMGVQSSVIPWVIPAHHTEIAGHGLSYTAVSGPAHVPVWPHHAHAPAAVAIHASPAHVHVAADPWHDHHAHAVHVAADPWHDHHSHAVHVAADPWHDHHAHDHHAHVVVAPAHEATYVAKTRGAVHTAPLAGHTQSAAAINVAPAPGTH